MKKLTLTLALLLTAATAAHAQAPSGTPNGNPNNDSLRYAIRIGDPVKTQEAMIEASRATSVRIESEADAERRSRPGTFDAAIKVTNSAAKAIKAVIWRATLLDAETGAVIRTYDVTSKTSIAPGKTKTLSKQLQTPRAHVLKATSQTPRKAPVADLKVKVTVVTYEDGSTSETP